MNIVLEIKEKDRHILDEVSSKFPNEIEIVSVIRFDGSSDLLHALITLTAITLPLVTRMIVELLRSKKHHRVTKDGMEITGFSEKNTIKMLEKLLEKEEHE